MDKLEPILINSLGLPLRVISELGCTIDHMAQIIKNDTERQAVCGQAHAVFDILNRTASLPVGLSLSIEEILERAWEIAYHRDKQQAGGNVVHLAQFSAMRASRSSAEY